MWVLCGICQWINTKTPNLLLVSGFFSSLWASFCLNQWLTLFSCCGLCLPREDQRERYFLALLWLCSTSRGRISLPTQLQNGQTGSGRRNIHPFYLFPPLSILKPLCYSQTLAGERGLQRNDSFVLYCFLICYLKNIIFFGVGSISPHFPLADLPAWGPGYKLLGTNFFPY